MKELFMTEKEALYFIHSNFGEDAILKPSSIGDRDTVDGDGLPFSWSGETAAYDVNGGEAVVGFWESADAQYKVSFRGVEVVTDALYYAREFAEQMKSVAEDCNVAGEIIISEPGSELDSITVDLYDDDEPEGSAVDFAKAWRRYRIGIALRYYRHIKCLNIRKFAAMTGVSKNTISDIECGNDNYTIDTLTTLCHALNVSISDLERYSEFD